MPVTKQDRPWYFDCGKWRRVPSDLYIARSDIRNPCALCGWGKHMAIHSCADGTEPAGTLGIHSWISREPPNHETTGPSGSGA